MVDVDRRPPQQHPCGLPQPSSHAAGLRRLSTRAAAPLTPRPSTPTASQSPSENSDPSSILSHLAAAGVAVHPGLSAAELARAEAALGGLQLPPDLRAVLLLGVPYGHGFPDYRSPAGLRLLRFAALDVPIAVINTLHLARRRGSRPPLVQVYGRYYLPARPCLAGNPVFLVADSNIAIAGADIADFFFREPSFATQPQPPPPASLRRQLSAPMPPLPPVQSSITAPPTAAARRSLDSVTGKAPRWIEFWSDATAGERRLPDSNKFLEIRTQATMHVPDWLQSYLDWVGSVLKHGGWDDGEVVEMVNVAAAAGFSRVDAVVADGGATMGVTILKVDWCSDVLRRGGWSADEVVDVLGLLLGPRRARPAVAIPPDVAMRVGKLAEAVSRSIGSDDPKRARWFSSLFF